MAAISPTDTRLLPRLRAFFGLSQTDLGRCLGLSRSMISQVEVGTRGLPLKAALPQVALTLALHTTPAEPPAEAADVARLQRRQQKCLLRANELAYELGALPARATWARRRLAALPRLTAALVPAGEPLPVWLAFFAAEARHELASSGSTAQALLQLRQAAFAYEAEQIRQLLPIPTPPSCGPGAFGR
jgi:transcriptional regulator with XRE-family HTH domain